MSIKLARRRKGRLALIAMAALATTQFGSAMPVLAQDDVTFVYAVPAVAQNLDPGMWEGDPGRWTKWEQGSNLAAYDYTGLEGNGCNDLATIGDVKLDLAESFELSEDGTHYTIRLKEAKSPYGNTLSAEDVVWSFARHKELSGVSRNMYFTQAKYRQDNTIEVIDDRTVRLNLDRATSMDLPIHTISAFALKIYDSTEAKKHATEADPWAKDWMASNTADYGPWMAESFDPGNEVVYVPNPNYAGERGNIDRLVIRGIPEASTRLQLLQAGEVDYTTRLSFDEYQSLAGSSDVVVETCLSPNRDTLMMQLADERFADERVRKAISYAIDREGLVNGVYRGFATPSVTSLPVGYGSPSSGETLSYDPEKAKALLAEAGFADGFEASMLMHSSRPGPHAEQLAVILQAQLQQVGLNWTIEVAPSAADFNTRFNEGRYEAIVYLDPPAVADPLYTLVNYNASTAAQNTHNYENPEYDALVQELATVLETGPERDAILEKIDAVVMETMPMIYLVDRNYIHAYRSNVQGFVNAPNGELPGVMLSKE
jgi:peptide/nickel transport system substrate-binding protein